MNKDAAYRDVTDRIAHIIEGEVDDIAVMATIACELHQAFTHFNWVGFYRVTGQAMLTIGPYQGGHGCLRIPFSKGVCGKCAREKATQLVDDVTLLPYHIACSSATRSEIVIPILDAHGAVRAVLDIDSDKPTAFDAIDQLYLERIAVMVP